MRMRSTSLRQRGWNTFHGRIFFLKIFFFGHEGCFSVGDHLPYQPVGFGLVAEMFCHRKFPPVAGADFQIVIRRVPDIRPDLRRDVRHVRRFHREPFVEAEPGRFNFYLPPLQSQPGCGETKD